MAYLPLSTANLPDPVIDPAQGSSPEDYFNTVLYTGTGSYPRAVTGVGFQPDFVWMKSRVDAYGHCVYDAVRGVGTSATSLRIDSTDAEGGINIGPYVDLDSLDSDGFTLGNTVSETELFNENTKNFVAWNWKANGSGVSNTDGSITSTVSANTESGFSIVTFTGTGATSETVGHGLNSTPELVIAKRRDNVSDWFVYSKEFPNASYYMYLNSTAAQAVYNPFWNSTAPTSSVFTIGSIFGSGGTYLAYCFHSVEGFSKFGSYVGNGSTDGTFVYTGFRPAFVMVKSSSAGEHWNIPVFTTDTNGSMNTLSPNLSNAERTMDQNPAVDFVSNGFKIRTSDANYNSNGGSYIYMAFAEDGGPFKYSRAR